MKRDSDPKNVSKSKTEWLKKKRIMMLQWSSKSPDFNLIEILQQDIKRAINVSGTIL